jgi:hypothetical protein
MARQFAFNIAHVVVSSLLLHHAATSIHTPSLEVDVRVFIDHSETHPSPLLNKLSYRTKNRDMTSVALDQCPETGYYGGRGTVDERDQPRMRY